jgi:hypothetical protein
VQVFAESLRAPWSQRAHSAMARRNRLPLGARQHHPTLVLFTLRRTNADLGRSEKVRFSHIAAAGLANLQSDRQKLRCRLTGPCRMVSVRSISALSLRSALTDKVRQSEQELLWFCQVGRTW